MKYGLQDKTIEAICNVLETFPEIDRAILYGSRAKGTYRNGSDIDLTVVGNNLILHTINKLELEIDTLLLPYSFDISIYHHISNVDLLEHIKRVGVVFFER